MPLERHEQDSLRESFLPSIATEAESWKETLHPSPWEACVKPVTASLKTYCGCQDSFTSLPSRVSSSEQVTNPTASFEVTLHTSILLFIKEMADTARSNFCIIYMIKVSMHFSLAMSVYTILAESQESWNFNNSQNENLGYFLLKMVFTNSLHRKMCKHWNTMFGFQYYE